MNEVLEEAKVVSQRAEKARKADSKLKGLFEAERRKNGELLDELHRQQVHNMREEQEAQEKALEQKTKALAEERAKVEALEKKVEDLEHTKDLWKSAAESARNVMKKQGKTTKNTPAAPAT